MVVDFYKISATLCGMNFAHRIIHENMAIVSPKVGDAIEVLSYQGEVFSFGIAGTSPVRKVGRGARPIGIEQYVKEVLNLKVGENV